MVSAAISWYGVTKPFFVNSNGIKVNKENYCRRLRKELFPAMDKVVRRDDRIFAEDGAQFHRYHLIKDFVKTKLKYHFTLAKKWPPSLPDVDPLDYIYWDFVKTKVTKEDLENCLDQKLN